MNRMKILLITPLRGGIGHWSRCLIEELDKLVDITIVTYKRKRKEDDIKPFIRVDDEFILEVIDPNRPQYLIEYNNEKSLEELVDLTDKIKPDCVYFVMWAGRQITWFLKEYSKILTHKNIPLILTLHEAYPQIIQNGDIQLFNAAYINADYIIVLTDDARNQLKRNGVNISISIIPHGNYHMMNKNQVDDKDAKKIISKLLSVDITEEFKVILFFGFIREYKGLIYLIRAAPYVLKKTSNILFIAAGSMELDENPSQYQEEICKLKLDRNFILYPEFIEDYLLMEAFYKVADIVVFPYIGISQSGVMFTALGMKRPVIISNIGSFIKKLEQQHVFLTSIPKNPKDIAEKILYLLKYEKERKDLSERGYRILEKEYNWKKIANEYYKIFQNIKNK